MISVLSIRRLAAAAFCLAFLAACVPGPEPAFGECEPGVSDLGRSADATPVCP